jgi:hypothetical protein
VKTATRVALVSLSLVLAAGATGFVWNESPPAMRGGMRAAEEDADAPECPGPNIAIRVDSAHGTPGVTYRHIVEIAQGISTVPEFHDCQRFVTRSPGGQPIYGALYAVFAAKTLADQTFDPDTSAFAAAEVYTRRGEYPGLGIKPGFNCLYLSKANGWKAFMVSVGLNDDTVCKPRMSLAQRLGATSLRVTRHVYGNMKPNEYPGVTRWDMDQAGHYYITMRCGAGWCDVGLEEPARASRALTLGDGISEPERRVRTIKGWYDQQVLAIPSGENVRPQAIVGTVIPVPGLADLPFDATTYLQVATIEIGDIPQYKSKLGLKRGTNLLFMRGEGDNWDAYVQAPDGEKKYLKAHRHGHEGQGFNIPGTVRWRWLSKDETIWVRCLEGCCQVQED